MQTLAFPTDKVSYDLRVCLSTLGFTVGNARIRILAHPVEHRQYRLELGIVFAHILDRLSSRNRQVPLDVFDAE